MPVTEPDQVRGYDLLAHNFPLQYIKCSDGLTTENNVGYLFLIYA